MESPTFGSRKPTISIQVNVRIYLLSHNYRTDCSIFMKFDTFVQNMKSIFSLDFELFYCFVDSVGVLSGIFGFHNFRMVCSFSMKFGKRYEHLTRFRFWDISDFVTSIGTVFVCEFSWEHKLLSFNQSS